MQRPGRNMRHAMAMATAGLAAVVCAAASPASAQPAVASSGTAQIAVPGPVASSHPTIDITPATPADGSFSLQSPVTGVPAGAQPMPAAGSVATSFDEFSRNVHGYASAGVGTHDGHEFSGGVLIPLVPGKLELEAGGGTAQQGGLAPFRSGSKANTIRGTSYYAALHAHPSDDVDITVGFSHTDLHGPLPLYR